MAYRLIIDGNSVYEIDEECECKRRENQESGKRKNGCGKSDRERCGYKKGER